MRKKERVSRFLIGTSARFQCLLSFFLGRFDPGLARFGALEPPLFFLSAADGLFRLVPQFFRALSIALGIGLGEFVHRGGGKTYVGEGHGGAARAGKRKS